MKALFLAAALAACSTAAHALSDPPPAPDTAALKGGYTAVTLTILQGTADGTRRKDVDLPVDRAAASGPARRQEFFTRTTYVQGIQQSSGGMSVVTSNVNEGLSGYMQVLDGTRSADPKLRYDLHITTLESLTAHQTPAGVIQLPQTSERRVVGEINMPRRAEAVVLLRATKEEVPPATLQYVAGGTFSPKLASGDMVVFATLK